MNTEIGFNQCTGSETLTQVGMGARGVGAYYATHGGMVVGMVGLNWEVEPFEVLHATKTAASI